MNKIIKNIIGLLLVIGPVFLFAHNPLSASYSIEANKNISLLNIYLSQSGVHNTLKNIYGETYVDTLKTKGYKELVIRYVKENFNLSFDGKEVKLLEGGIKLGNHQTDLKFIVSQIPEKFDKLSLSVNAFSMNKNHQTIFMYNLFGRRDNFILNKKNKYQTEVLFTEKKTDYSFLFILTVAISLILFTFLMVNKKS